GWNSGGCRNRRAAQIVAGKTGLGNFGNQSRREHGRKCLLLRDGWCGAGSGVAPYSFDCDVALRAERKSQVRSRGTHRAQGGRNYLERRIAGPSSAEHQRAGAVEGRRAFHAAIEKNYAQSIDRRKRSEGSHLLLDLRTENRKRYRAGYGFPCRFWR